MRVMFPALGRELFSVQASFHHCMFPIGNVLHVYFHQANPLSLPCFISVVILQEILASAPEITNTILKARTTTGNRNTVSLSLPEEREWLSVTLNLFKPFVYLFYLNHEIFGSWNTSPELGDGLASSLRVSLLAGTAALELPDATAMDCDITTPWSSLLSSKFPINAFLIMSSRPRLLAGSAKEWPLELTAPGR